MATTSSSLDAVVGRADELALLNDFLSGEGSELALTIEGEAGIGKTTLWRAGTAIARERSDLVLSCRPAPAEVQLSYAALGDLLGDVLPEALPELPEPQRRALAVALLLEEVGARAPPPAEAVAIAVHNVFRALAREHRVLVAVDDVQWLDASSAAMLAFAARRLEGPAVKLLLAERRDPAAPKSRLVEAVPDEVRARLCIGPLSLGAVHHLVSARLGEALPRHSLVRVHETSGGNPFFALELARAVIESPDGIEGEPLPVPRSLLDLVSDRLAGLPARVRTVLEIVAALSDATVARVEAAAPGRNVRAALDRATAAGVVELDGERIRFAHPLLAAAVVRGIDPAARRRLHRTLADVVADPEERGRHLALAADAPNEGVAAALDAAAARARARGAPAAAAELAEQAWRLTPPQRREDVQRRKIAAAEQHVQAGDLARARVLLEQAVAELSPGPLRARGLWTLGIVQAHELAHWKEARATIEQALREAGDDLRLRAELERQLGWAYAADFQAAKAEPHVLAARELAHRLDDRVLFAEALAVHAHVEFLRGRGLRRDLFDRALELALETLYEHRRVSRHPYFVLALPLRWAGDFDAARACLESLLRLAVERGEESMRPFLLSELGVTELAAGNWPGALRYSDDAYAAAVDTAQESPRLDALWLRASVDAYRGNVEPARRWAEERLLAPDGEIFDVRVMLGFLALSLGDAQHARDHLEPALAEARRNGVEDPSVFPFWPDAIEALVGTGALAEAEQVLEWLEERGLTLDRPWALATAGRCRALLCAAMGDITGALHAATDALAAHERLSQPFELGRTLLVKGGIERRAKQKRAARDSLQQALALFEELGARLWAERARAELARIGGRTRSAGELTPTERRVAALVAEGRSNQEVAAALFIAPRTVEWNLTKIYAKLGVRSRTELAGRLSSS